MLNLCKYFGNYFGVQSSALLSHRKTLRQMKKKLPYITGASSGIGFELAKIFAREGNDIVVAKMAQTSRTKNSLEKIFNKAFIISKTYQN
jgi:short-subunit dehydrogenase involved in D-alanine esterification of teichoic acids